MTTHLAEALDLGEQFWLKENAGIAGDPRYSDIASLINVILPNVIIIASVILFILLLSGGFMFIIGAGGGESDKTKKGKQAITAALVGFLIIFGSYWIFQIIRLFTIGVFF